ncbi:glycerol-3-phosphate acyltransferase [Proteiniclasticum ruminis]|uniref:Acyl-phosphate glycerol-3-phosphate acyltransferase n=1 Tax=Proteiniclasticum ruminis TaxID=398199 RepID=A0A1I5E475_9CLOT|nr:glycerol-3-phosphate acyltransferase [Proteiniclasticum ruminis]SFO06133.1 acyl-phosphate glycerol-3-phosphate acyltransferase [Proteiniclasticum ruminis]
MMEWQLFILLAVLGYLIGSISFARILFHVKRPGEEPVKIRTVSTDGSIVMETHAVGATSALLAFGKKWGLLIMALDLLKALMPMTLYRVLGEEPYGHLVLGNFILMGHLWPVYNLRKGGGGNSTAMGMMLAASPLGFLVTQVLGMVIGMKMKGVMFMAGILLSIPWFMMTKGIFSAETLFALVMSVTYLAAQMPETMKFLQLKKKGYTFDSDQVLHMMRHGKGKTDRDEQREG